MNWKLNKMCHLIYTNTKSLFTGLMVSSGTDITQAAVLTQCKKKKFVYMCNNRIYCNNIYTYVCSTINGNRAVSAIRRDIDISHGCKDLIKLLIYIKKNIHLIIYYIIKCIYGMSFSISHSVLTLYHYNPSS